MTLDSYLTRRTDTITIFNKKLLLAESISIERKWKLLTLKEN
jgi:hypothetical protein